MTYTNPYHTVQTTRRVLFGIAWLALALCLAAAPMEGTSAAQTATLVLGGTDAPDGNGTLLGASALLTLNAKGDVAFVCEFSNTQNPSTDSRGICLANTKSFKQLVRTGEPVPDGNGTFNHFAHDFNTMERIVLNDNGSVAFTANLTGTAGGLTDNVGLFSASATAGVKQFVRTSDAAPDGNGIFAREYPNNFALPGLSPPGLDNSGTTMFHGVLTGTSGGPGVDDTGVFRSGGNTTRLIRAGQTVPDGDEVLELVYLGLASNPGGQVAMNVSIAFEFTGEPPGDDLERIYLHTGNVLKEVVRSGIPIPDGNGHLVGFFFGSLGIADNGNVTFIGSVNGSDNYLLDGIRIFHTNGTTLTQIVRQGELGPGEQEFRFGFFAGIDSNNQDKVAFSATLNRNAVPPDNRTSGIYVGDGNGITLLVHQGDALPGGNGTFGSVATALFQNNNGEIAFLAALEGTDDPANDNKGIFFIGSDRSIQTVARHGMPLAGSTILWVSFLGEFVTSLAEEANQFLLSNSDLNLAGMNAINDAGQVAFVATLTDGRSGVFLWQASDAPPPDDNTIFADSFE